MEVFSTSALHINGEIRLSLRQYFHLALFKCSPPCMIDLRLILEFQEFSVPCLLVRTSKTVEMFGIIRSLACLDKASYSRFVLINDVKIANSLLVHPIILISQTICISHRPWSTLPFFSLDLAAADHVVIGVMYEGSFCVGKTYHRKPEEWLEMCYNNSMKIHL